MIQKSKTSSFSPHSLPLVYSSLSQPKPTTFLPYLCFFLSLTPSSIFNTHVVVIQTQAFQSTSMSSFICHQYYPSICSSKHVFPINPTSLAHLGFHNFRQKAQFRSLNPQCLSEITCQNDPLDKQKKRSLSMKECAISIALAVGLIVGEPSLSWQREAQAVTPPALPDLAVLISGPPIKDPEALLRYALPIDNKAIREVQKPLEDITDSLKVAGLKALDSVERNIKQASRAYKNGKSLIISGLAESKKEHGIELLDKLEAGMDELQQIVDNKNRDGVAPKQRELLRYVGGVEEDMVDGFPYEVREEYQSMPLLKGRAVVDMKVKVKDNPNLEDCVFRIVLDGYNAPVTAGNFVDLVKRRFYDGMEIQRADGFVVQTGDPEGPAEGFIDPSTEKPRTIPLEIMAEGEKVPFYGATLEELGLYKAQTKLPFNAFGTMAMAREEFEDNSGSSQVFWLLKESELTPSNANILDGRYAVFGYVIDNQDFLADLKVGDAIESVQVVSGLDNLVNPTYKIAR